MKHIPRIRGFPSFNTARRSIQGFEAMLWIRKGFSFTGRWTVVEQNWLLEVCFGLLKLTKRKPVVIQTRFETYSGGWDKPRALAAHPDVAEAHLPGPKVLQLNAVADGLLLVRASDLQQSPVATEVHTAPSVTHETGGIGMVTVLISRGGIGSRGLSRKLLECHR